MTRAGGKRTVAIDELLEAQAGQVFHHVIECAVLGAAVVEDLDRVPVRQPGRRPHLELEPGQDPWASATGWGGSA